MFRSANNGTKRNKNHKWDARGLVWHGIGLCSGMKIVHLNINQPMKKIETSIKAMLRVEYNNLKANVRFLSNHPANQPQFPGFIA